MTDTKSYQLNKLVIPEIKQVYQLTNSLPLWLRHLILGLLIAIQERYIQAKVTQTVTDAIESIDPILDSQDDHHWQKNATITITENPNSLHQFPTLTISAPYSEGFKN